MKKLIVFMTLILLVGMTPTVSQAAGVLTPIGSGHQPIRIRDHHVNVVIYNGFAMTEVQQTFYNANTFLVLGSLCEIMDAKKYYAAVGISAIFIPVGLRWGMPDLMIYGGLSGLDCALYSLLMVLFIKREIRSRSWIWVALFSILLGGLVAKIIYETATGLTIFVGNTHTNMIPLPLAHPVGGCVGFAVGILGVKSGSAAGLHFYFPNQRKYIPGKNGAQSQQLGVHGSQQNQGA